MDCLVLRSCTHSSGGNILQEFASRIPSFTPYHSRVRSCWTWLPPQPSLRRRQDSLSPGLKLDTRLRRMQDTISSSHPYLELEIVKLVLLVFFWSFFYRSLTVSPDHCPAHLVTPDFVEVSAVAHTSHVSDLHLQIGYGPAWASARLATRELLDPGNYTVWESPEGFAHPVWSLCQQRLPEVSSRAAVTRQFLQTRRDPK